MRPPFVHSLTVWPCGGGEGAAGAGADVDKAKDGGATPLYIASHQGHVNVVSALLDNGADASLTFNGQTPFQAARMYGHTEIMSLLEGA